jgi:hypothetical protein
MNGWFIEARVKQTWNSVIAATVAVVGGCGGGGNGSWSSCGFCFTERKPSQMY